MKMERKLVLGARNLKNQVLVSVLFAQKSFYVAAVVKKCSITTKKNLHTGLLCVDFNISHVGMFLPSDIGIDTKNTIQCIIPTSVTMTEIKTKQDT